jgi:hypothetical protein
MVVHPPSSISLPWWMALSPGWLASSLSSSLFHPQSTPQAVACEAGGGLCVIACHCCHSTHDTLHEQLLMRLGAGGALFGAGPVCAVSYREKAKEIKKLLMAQEMLLTISWVLVPTFPWGWVVWCHLSSSSLIAATIPHMIHLTSSCSWGWGQVVCHPSCASAGVIGVCSQ